MKLHPGWRPTTQGARRYGLVVVAVALASLVRWSFPSALTPAPYLAFFPAVVLAAVLGGVGPALVAVVISVLVVHLGFGHIDLHQQDAMVRLIIWVSSTLGVSVLAGMQRAARLREHRQADELRRWKDELEVRVDKRTAELQEVNGQLLRANEKLAELDQAKTVFFSNVSHEFRTPLTLMLAPLEDLLAHRGAGPDDEERLRIIHRNALRLLKLVNALLDFSRIEAGRTQVRPCSTDLASLTRDVASFFCSAFDKAGLRFDIDCPPLGKPAFVDPDMWEKIVLNLISNAFKFTLEGGVELKLVDAGDACHLVVRDSGVGIPEADLPHIFERFHRVEMTRGRSLEGSGIGLSLVRELVGLQGGTIRVESALGAGTTFTVTQPYGIARIPDQAGTERDPSSSAGGARPFVEEALRWLPAGADGAEAMAPSAAGTSAAAPADGVAAERERVLVADDNADMRAYVQRLLEGRFSVETVGDGQAALEAARRRPPALVLTDVMMPRLDGFGLLRELRADPALGTVPVIMLSARAGEEAKGEGIEAGADDYLVKPFSGRELLARVTTNLKLARARIDIERAHGREQALQETDRRKNEFISMMSHELRNPLAPVRTNLAILERVDPAGAQATRAREVLKRQVAHFARLLDDLLDASRIVRGKVQLRLTDVDIGGLLRSTADDHRALMREAGIEFVVHTPDEPLIVRGDETRIVQVVGNLLQNASKFTPKGGRVELSANPDGRYAVIRVHDTGRGIAPSFLPHLFEPFIQAEQTLARTEGGLGLGLYTVKGLTDLHGGVVTGESPGPNQGSMFTVRLPLAARPDVAQGDVEWSSPRAGSTSYS